MKKIFSILLSLALLLSLVVLTTAPVAAVTLPSISPTSATYSLDSPAQIVVGIDFGGSTGLANITNIANGTILNPGTDYVTFETILVLTTSYLGGALTMPGQTLNLQFNFVMPGPYVYDQMLTITSTGTNPILAATSKDWNFNTKGNVTTDILWGFANSVISVGDNVGLLAGPGLPPANNWTANSTSLIVMENYFKGRWPTAASIGQSVVLNVKFDKGANATLTVKCVGVATPSLTPTVVYWDYLKTPLANATATITWGQAAAVVAVLDYTYPNIPAYLTGNWSVVGNTLNIGSAWLITVLNDTMSKNGYTYRLLLAVFNDGNKAPLVVVAGPSSPSVAPATANWDLDKDLSIQTNNYVYTVPAFSPTSAATAVTNVTDQYGYNLTIYTGTSGTGGACNLTWPNNFDYRVAFNPILNAFVVSFWTCYFLNANPNSGGKAPLSVPGDVVVLTLSFDKGMPVTFTVTATGGGAKLSPTAADFNLDAPADVATTVNWGKWATNITSIAGLTRGVDFTLSPDGGNVTVPSTLTIDKDYLLTVLAQPDDSVTLNVVFNAGAPATFTITAIGTPSCFIATAAGADAPQLDILRAFRDEVLRPNAPWLVSFYYEVSPSIAKVIAGNEALKWLVKELVVDPAACIAEWLLGCC